MTESADLGSPRPTIRGDGFVRDPFADDGAVLAARQRPFSERLEVAISWNKTASELQNGMAQTAPNVPSTVIFDAAELFRVLASREVNYIVIGGVALQAHGGQRLTPDLDVAVELSRQNRDRVAAALADVDARELVSEQPQQELLTRRASHAGSNVQRRQVTAYGHLDLVALPPLASSFARLRAHAHEVPLRGVVVPIACCDDLIALKRAAGRPQDLADVRLLESFA